MKKAVYEDFLNMKIGQPVVVNIDSGVADIAVFLGFNKEKGCAIVCDCLLHSKEKYSENIAEYKEVFIFPSEKEELLKLLQKRM